MVDSGVYEVDGKRLIIINNREDVKINDILKNRMFLQFVKRYLLDIKLGDDDKRLQRQFFKFYMVLKDEKKILII